MDSGAAGGQQDCFTFDYFTRVWDHYGYGGKIQDIREKEFRRVKGNPHSQNISSRLTHDTIEHVRYRRTWGWPGTTRGKLSDSSAA
nr:PREDICTED: molybdenum cofactor sulfurase-like [Latimeria chalumnae]|eukprot:XP_014351045.1 PREDICTED: molybdenum cofactor sulfurase-like [Latimeria chalumnae]